MKMNKIILGMSLALGMVSMGHAATTLAKGNGSVTFTGSVIDAACSIEPESVDQTVNLGMVSKVALKDKGSSVPQNFEIQLSNCDLEGAKKTVSATFTGTSGATTGMLGMTGTAKGASIALTDGAGKLIKLGEATTTQALQTGTNSLQFSAYLQGDGASDGIIPGDFKSVANFTLTYQ